MKIIEYGKENDEHIMLLHAGGLSWWNYLSQADQLKKNYHVILPVLDGHAQSDVPFTTIEDNASRLIEYIDKELNSEVLLIAGVSLGSQILVEMLSQRSNICKYALIESALVVEMPLIKALSPLALDISYGLIKRKWLSKMQFKSLKIPESLFDYYYRDTCKIQKEDMKHFLMANASYKLKPSLTDTTAKVSIVAGSKEERKMLSSAKILHDALKESKLTILNGYYHGELSLKHPEEYVEMLKSLMLGA